MGTRITKSLVDNYPVPAPQTNGKPSQAFVRDSAIPGFGLRVTSGGTKSFIVETRIRGRVKRSTLGKYGQLTVAQARSLAMQRLGIIAQGRDPQAEKRVANARSATLSDAFEDYLLSRKDLKPGTIKNYRKCVDGCLADWKAKRLLDLTKPMIEQRHRSIGERAPARANNVMRVLRAVFNHAMDTYEDEAGNPTIATNPVARLSKARAWYRIERRTGHLKPHQLSTWYEGLRVLPNRVTQDYLLFLLMTGLRKNEAATLTWDQVDLQGRTFTIADTKNRMPHTLPLTPALSALLARRQDESESPWVFPSPRGDGHLRDSRNAIARVAEETGIKFTHHDLRRTFITAAEGLDISAYALKRLANHKMPNDVTSGYIITDVERLRKPMEKVSRFFEKHLFAAEKAQHAAADQPDRPRTGKPVAASSPADGNALQLSLLIDA